MKQTILSQPLRLMMPQAKQGWHLLLRNLNFFCKRLFDLLVTVCTLVVLSPIALLIALCIKFDTPGPILFTQERVGAKRYVRGNKEVWEIRNFRIYKFRSMVTNADPTIHQEQVKAFVEGRLNPVESGQETVKVLNDPRVTRVGRFLRKTSMDELPQLLNILRGEMSLVGPRPVPTYEVALYQEEHYERLMALPGITGLWQVMGRGQVTFEQMVNLDLAYVQQQSIWLDFWILAMTIPAVIRGEGAT